MDLSAIVVVLGGVLLFFGFIAWMEIYSRRKSKTEGQSETE